MSGECVYDILPPDAEGESIRENEASSSRRSRRAAPPPPTASTFGIHGTSAIVSNVAGESTDPSVHPARRAGATFGRQVGADVSPSNFLRKNEGVLTASRGAKSLGGTNFKISERDCERRKPDVPGRQEKPVMGLKSDINFVRANATEKSASASSERADATQLRAVDRPGFGQVPKYLGRIKADIAQRREMVATMDRQTHAANDLWSELTESEKNDLRDGLQRRWDALNKAYQTKGFSNAGTPSQKLQQEQLETNLRAVEFALQKLSREHVFIYDDDRERDMN